MSNATNHQSSAPAQQSQRSYIDLHTSGIGYISRIREVPVRKGQPFWACTIRAMHGEKGVQDGIQYVPFDVKACTDETREILQKLQADANDKNFRVMVQFKIGDFYIDTFKYTSGDKAGESCTMLKGRLVQVYRAWVKHISSGGEQQGWDLVYQKPDTSSANSQPAHQEESSPEQLAA